MKLEIDPSVHPVDWGAQRLIEGGQLARFNKRFQSFGMKNLNQSPKILIFSGYLKGLTCILSDR